MEKDPNIEKNRFEMEAIWNRCEKESNLPPHLKGEHIRYFATDPEYLYQQGFVDTEKYSLEDWKKAFQEIRQPDGTFLISKEKFISLGKYKYSGPIKKPLDAMQIREGWYKLSHWHQFISESVLPSITLNIDIIIQGEKFLEKQGKIKNNKIYIDKNDKLRIKQILDQYPSPIRLRELGIAKLYESKLKNESERSKAAIVKTTYKTGQKLGDEEKKELKETLLKSAKISSTKNEEAPTLSLKDLRKKSKDKKQPL